MPGVGNIAKKARTNYDVNSHGSAHSIERVDGYACIIKDIIDKN
jgi:hypothetical protein